MGFKNKLLENSGESTDRIINENRTLHHKVMREYKHLQMLASNSQCLLPDPHTGLPAMPKYRSPFRNLVTMSPDVPTCPDFCSAGTHDQTTGKVPL